MQQCKYVCRDVGNKNELAVAHLAKPYLIRVLHLHIELRVNQCMHVSFYIIARLKISHVSR